MAGWTYNTARENPTHHAHHHHHSLIFSFPGFDAGTIRIANDAFNIQVYASAAFSDPAFPGSAFPNSIEVIYNTPHGGQAVLNWLEGSGWAGFFDRYDSDFNLKWDESLGQDGRVVPHTALSADTGEFIHVRHDPSFSDHDVLIFA